MINIRYAPPLGEIGLISFSAFSSALLALASGSLWKVDEEYIARGYLFTSQSPVRLCWRKRMRGKLARWSNWGNCILVSRLRSWSGREVINGKKCDQINNSPAPQTSSVKHELPLNTQTPLHRDKHKEDQPTWQIQWQWGETGPIERPGKQILKDWSYFPIFRFKKC